MSCRSFSIVLVLFAISLEGCSTVRPRPPAPPVAAPAPASAIIYVVRRSWHIDIGFASGDLSPPLDSSMANFPGTHYLLFGFGDRRYLHSKDKGLPNLLGALLPGPGLILMTALAATPAQAFGVREVIALPATADQLRAAQAAVWASLATRDGAVQSDGAGPYEGSAYLRASQRYSALNTCNTWAAQVLRAAGFPVRSRGVVFAGQLWRQTRRLAQPVGQ